MSKKHIPTPQRENTREFGYIRRERTGVSPHFIAAAPPPLKSVRLKAMIVVPNASHLSCYSCAPKVFPVIAPSLWLLFRQSCCILFIQRTLITSRVTTGYIFTGALNASASGRFDMRFYLPKSGTCATLSRVIWRWHPLKRSSLWSTRRRSRS